jgi:hypothetical protein
MKGLNKMNKTKLENKLSMQILELIKKLENVDPQRLSITEITSLQLWLPDYINKIEEYIK